MRRHVGDPVRLVPMLTISIVVSSCGGEGGDGSQYGIPGWGNNELQWYLPDSSELRDGLLVITAREESQGSKAFPAPFDQPFYVLFNVAVGGNWPGSPGAGTVFPVTMEVDYVRVYSGDP